MADPVIITVQDRGVGGALQVLRSLNGDMHGFLLDQAEAMTERIKRRFETSTAPDGTPWKPNSEVTLDLFTATLGKSFRKKSGDLNAKGERRVAGKKPLIGESGDLRRQIVPRATDNELGISFTPIYAAIQHFGGQAGRNLKVTIPARPFAPVQSDGTLYPEERAILLNAISDFINARMA